MTTTRAQVNLESLLQSGPGNNAEIWAVGVLREFALYCFDQAKRSSAFPSSIWKNGDRALGALREKASPLLTTEQYADIDGLIHSVAEKIEWASEPERSREAIDDAREDLRSQLDLKINELATQRTPTSKVTKADVIDALLEVISDTAQSLRENGGNVREALTAMHSKLIDTIDELDARQSLSTDAYLDVSSKLHEIVNEAGLENLPVAAAEKLEKGSAVFIAEALRLRGQSLRAADSVLPNRPGTVTDQTRGSIVPPAGR
jgi:hypothetical protein